MYKCLSVIIPALNEEENIGRCIEAIRSADRINMNIEIIVVDNGSFDKTAEIGQKLDAITFIKPGINISALRNFGAMHARGDLLAFVDADCIVSKDWHTKAIDCLNRESADAVGSFHIIPEGSGWVGKTAELIQSKKQGPEASYIPSGNMIITRSSFDALHGFDETLETNEDVDLCNRLSKARYKLFLDPSIKSVHLGSPKNIKQMFLREIWHGKDTFTVFINDLKKLKNLKIVTYTASVLFLLLSIMVGIILAIMGNKSILIASIILFFLLNLLVALRDWVKVRKGMFSLLLFKIIYGVARALSLAKWLLSILRRRQI